MTAPHRRPLAARSLGALAVAIACLVSVSGPATADSSSTFEFHFENDLFGDTDQHYTNGIKLTWTSPDLTRYRDHPALPKWSHALIDRLPFINEPGLERNVSISIGQSMFTPGDITRRDLIVDDRPYAGWLYLGVGFHNKNVDRQDHMELQMGFVGALSFAEQAQTLVHELRDLQKPRGWDNQLEIEPGLNAIYERKWRLLRFGRPRGPGMDLITHAGGALGNIYTYANAGLEARVGWNLPLDFGTSLIRPGGDTSDPVDSGGRRGFGIHLFAAVDGRGVLRDIFLDGNTFASSHSVDRRPFVADLAAGVSATWGPVKISYARALRTREFEGQHDDHNFGSITFALTF